MPNPHHYNRRTTANHKVFLCFLIGITLCELSVSRPLIIGNAQYKNEHGIKNVDDKAISFHKIVKKDLSADIEARRDSNDGYNQGLQKLRNDIAERVKKSEDLSFWDRLKEKVLSYFGRNPEYDKPRDIYIRERDIMSYFLTHEYQKKLICESAEAEKDDSLSLTAMAIFVIVIILLLALVLMLIMLVMYLNFKGIKLKNKKEEESTKQITAGSLHLHCHTRRTNRLPICDSTHHDGLEMVPLTMRRKSDSVCIELSSDSEEAKTLPPPKEPRKRSRSPGMKFRNHDANDAACGFGKRIKYICGKENVQIDEKERKEV